MTEVVTFQVVGDLEIHCASCEQRVVTALKRLPGVDHVRASAQTQRVVVTINPEQMDAARVRAKLEQMGYTVAPRTLETSQ